MLTFTRPECRTHACTGERVTMHRCEPCAEVLMARLRRAESRKPLLGGPANNGRPRKVGAPAKVLKALEASPGSTAAEVAEDAGVSLEAARRALRGLIALGEVRRQREKSFRYFVTGAI